MIGIYGGTFDPIHTGHLIIAEQVREILKLDKIVFLPNGNPPHKQKKVSDKYARFNMIRLAIEDNPNFYLSDIEIKKNEPSYTYNTLLELKKEFKDEIYFIIGADSLVNLHKWHRYEELITLCKIVVLPRVLENISNDKNNPDFLKNWIINQLKADLDNFILVDFPMLEISSTIIRENISNKKSVKYMLPEKVIKYIYEENLY
jgi:nicotinate-nucleotide adenylyltransferase